MRTIALRFSENFAPKSGTIKTHEELIQLNGYVWYGKLGSRISSAVAHEIMDCKSPRILLIQSGANERYWAFIDRIQFDAPASEEIPAYYRDSASDFGVWFRVLRFEKAPSDILTHCYVASSGKMLSNASRHSMSPYFIIDYLDDAATQPQ